MNKKILAFSIFSLFILLSTALVTQANSNAEKPLKTKIKQFITDFLNDRVFIMPLLLQLGKNHNLQLGPKPVTYISAMTCCLYCLTIIVCRI